MIVVVMGVSGVGKSVLGARLASALGCDFLEGDSLHTATHIQKMSAGIPLTDADRAPWLEAIHAQMLRAARERRSLVVACSALKQAYRASLAKDLEPRWVFLTGSPGLIAARLSGREGHFMNRTLLADQLRTLEPPTDAIRIDVDAPVEDLVQQILRQLKR